MGNPRNLPHAMPAIVALYERHKQWAGCTCEQLDVRISPDGPIVLHEPACRLHTPPEAA